LSGKVEMILTATAEALPMQRRDRVTAVPGIGLVGDRYATVNGYWSGDFGASRDVTLIDAGSVEGVAAETGIEVRAEDLRRNIVVRGVRISDFVGVRFRIGEVIVEGTSLCEPCVHLERVSGKPILRPFVHRGGLRANILSPGEITVGDIVEPDVPNLGVAVVVRRDGRYLLGRRRGQRGYGTWSTPGGSVRPGETVLGCALRELGEETALVGTAPRVVGRSVDVIDDADWCSVYVAVDVAAGREPDIVEHERCDAWEWFLPSRLPTPLFAPVRRLLLGDYQPLTA
jgi:MOSC domain-containing protein YiiM